MGEDRDRLGAVPIVLWPECPPHRRHETEHIEVVGCDEPTDGPVRIGCGVDDRERPIPILDEFVQRASALSEVLDFLEGERHVGDTGGDSRLAYIEDSVSVFVRKRLQEHPVDDAENRGVQPNPKTESEHEGQRVAGCPNEASNGMYDVSHHDGPSPCPHIHVTGCRYFIAAGPSSDN